MGCVNAKKGPYNNQPLKAPLPLSSYGSLDLNNYVDETEINREKLRKVAQEEMQGFHRVIGSLTY